ncbi:hypothetical protein PIB30_063434 [Stylosanthes scabra]|uniref:Uncharacterized protein n=1 Tax=Stylosanthes scabra TaxID=79078 RepID=A0ABU6WLE6_9FABA|nr:hypothetical protein [Stylosanthes scabra]
MQLKRRKEGGHEKFPSLWKPNQKARSLYRFTQSLHPIHFHWLSLAPDSKRETSLSNEIPDPRMPYRWNPEYQRLDGFFQLGVLCSIDQWKIFAVARFYQITIIFFRSYEKKTSHNRSW